MDWHSRYVVAWRLSNTLEADFCVDALKEALGHGWPQVSNTGRGSQFTSGEFTQVLQDDEVKISMDGKGRYAGNIFVERLWRTVKYEEVYLKTYASASEARRELGPYFRFYNDQRPHQALAYRTSAEVFQMPRLTMGRIGTPRGECVRRTRREYHWQGSGDSRLIPPRFCPNNQAYLKGSCWTALTECGYGELLRWEMVFVHGRCRSS